MKKIFKIIIILVILLFSYIYISYSNFKTDVLVKQNKIIEIKSGDTTKDLAKKLNINYYFLKYYLSNHVPPDKGARGFVPPDKGARGFVPPDKGARGFKLLKGRFQIKENSKIDDILNTLKRPLPEKQISVTILEGWNIFDIDDYLTKKGLINSGEYITYAENPKKIKALTKFYKFLNQDFKTLEGYLYPDTYSLKYPIKINELIIKQLDNFENKVTKPLSGILSPSQGKEAANNDFYKKIILASIVEKEEKNPKNRPIVAGILKYRLEHNWKLGADITVCYPHRLTSEQCKMVISKYINEKSDYNTRTMLGLPKTPIGNPSFSSINATINSQKTEYRYYLHNIKTGKIYYGKTNAEHEQNKKYMY